MLKSELKKQQNKIELLEIDQRKTHIKILGIPESDSLEGDERQIEELFLQTGVITPPTYRF